MAAPDRNLAGCAFHPRCPRAMARCRVERPELVPAGGTQVACWLYDEAAAGVADGRA